jgi:hypothetical protein
MFNRQLNLDRNSHLSNPPHFYITVPRSAFLNSHVARHLSHKVGSDAPAAHIAYEYVSKFSNVALPLR